MEILTASLVRLHVELSLAVSQLLFVSRVTGVVESMLLVLCTCTSECLPFPQSDRGVESTTKYGSIRISILLPKDEKTSERSMPKPYDDVPISNYSPYILSAPSFNKNR